MTDVRNQQEVTVTLIAVPRVAGNFTNEIEEFMVGLRRFFKNILGRELSADEEELYRPLFSEWNTFLQTVQGVRGSSAIISSNINEDINKFILWLKELEGEQWSEVDKERIKLWLPRWNKLLQARAGNNIAAGDIIITSLGDYYLHVPGETLVTWWNICFTILGFLFYIVDLVTDIGTSMYYASKGQWRQAMVTLTLVYGAVIIHAVWKWIYGYIHCTGVADWLRYVASSLVNWPDLKHYRALCLLEWKMCKSPIKNAHLIPEWHRRRVSVARLKFMEGVCEACPQAILQLYLLVPDLYGDWTWTDYLRIIGASISLCTAGAALVNREKSLRIINYTDVPPHELAVLHVWAVPVTVSRLLSVTLLLTVHPYWALAGVTLHLVLRGVYWCRTGGVSRTLADVIDLCLFTLLFFMSPFKVDASITYHRVSHTIHFLSNTAATVVWALGTPLVGAHPALYTAIICFNAVMFVVGLLGWQLHGNYWRR